MAEIITSTYRNYPVVTAYINDKLEFLSLVRKSEVGNIYVCKVDHVVKNLESAFVRYGKDKIGYVSFRSINSSVLVNRAFSDDGALKQGDEVILQIENEEIKSKKPSLSGYLSLTGKYCVVTLGRKGVGASKKLSDDVRQSLISFVRDKYEDLEKEFLPQLFNGSFGIIIRTESQELSEDELSTKLLADIRSCLLELIRLLDEGRKRTVGSILKENASQEEECHIEKARLFLHSRGIDDFSVKEHSYIHDVSGDIDKLLHNKIWLKSGAFLIIEQLESFNAIDVNTGKAIKGREDISEKVNLEAADEIVRQIRLRNLSGMILIDFINMRGKDSNQKLTEHMKELIKKDPIHINFVDITGLGIMELTRNKNDKSLKEIFLSQ